MDRMLNPRVMASSLSPFSCQFWTTEGGLGDLALALGTCIREATGQSDLKAVEGGPCLSGLEEGKTRNREVMKWCGLQMTLGRAEVQRSGL